MSSGGRSITGQSGWDRRFEERRYVIDYSIENRPFVDIIADLKDAEPAARASDLAGDSFVRVFMKSERESDACLPRADRVETVCFGADVRQLVEGKGSLETIALLDEGSFGPDGKFESRPYRGPLTALQLYRALSLPVSAVHGWGLRREEWRECVFKVVS